MLPLFIHNFRQLHSKYHFSWHSACDVACGAGHFAAFLHSYGVPVIGTDLSPAMIRVARLRYGRLGIKFVVQDMRNLQLPCRVDLLTCNFDALNYLLTVKDICRTFGAFRRNMTLHGHALFDIITGVRPDKEIHPGLYRVTIPGQVSDWQVQWDPVRRLRRVQIRMHLPCASNDRRVVEESHQQRAWPIRTIAPLLRKQGFCIRGIHCADTLLPAGAPTRRALFLVRREV